MSQWGKIDRANNSPIWGPVTVMKTANTVNRDALYNNVTANAYVTNTAFSNGYTAGVFGISPAEMSDSGQGQIASITVLTAGSGFTVRPVTTLTGGNGSGATTNTTAKVVAVTIVTGAGGSGYAPGDVVTINTSGAAGAVTTARFNVLTVNASASNTALTLSINTAGSFIALPTDIANNATTNTVGVGTGLRVNLSFGVAAVAVVANGTGYTSAPTVSFSGTGGTGATATAALRSEQSKVTAAGWNRREVLPNGRVRYECLVAMGSITDPGGGDTDDSLLPD